MKNILFLLFLNARFAVAQDSTAMNEILKFQKETVETYSHLKGGSQRKPSHYEFFPIQMKYRVVAMLKLTNAGRTIKMNTSRGVTVEYDRYGILSFSIGDKTFQLPVYRSLNANDIAKHKDLFIPFTDLTNGKLTYAAGRYIELPLPEKEGAFILDFNQAFNPYCAYSSVYSCPIVPAENNLDLEILAGIKYSGH